MFLTERQPYRKFCALTGLTPDTNLTVVQLHQFFGQCQSDASAFVLASLRIVNLNKSIKNKRQAVFWNTDAGVFYANLDNFGFRILG